MIKNTQHTPTTFYSWLSKRIVCLVILTHAPFGNTVEPAPLPLASASTPSFLPSIFALLFIIILMFGLTWFLKRIGIGAAGKHGSFMKTLAVTNLGTREKITLVEIGDVWLILGITPSSINTLHTLPKGSFDLPGNIDTAQAFSKLLERVKRPQHK